MMTRRQSFFAYAALLVGVITFASSFTRSTAGQQAATAQQAIGRYQIATSGSSGYPNLYVIDTVTGKIWHGDQTPQGLNWSELKAFPGFK